MKEIVSSCSVKVEMTKSELHLISGIVLTEIHKIAQNLLKGIVRDPKDSNFRYLHDVAFATFIQDPRVVLYQQLQKISPTTWNSGTSGHLTKLWETEFLYWKNTWKSKGTEEGIVIREKKDSKKFVKIKRRKS